MKEPRRKSTLKKVKFDPRNMLNTGNSIDMKQDGRQMDLSFDEKGANFGNTTIQAISKRMLLDDSRAEGESQSSQQHSEMKPKRYYKPKSGKKKSVFSGGLLMSHIDES